VPAVAVGLGFVSICLSEQDCSPAGDVTVTAIEKLPEEARISRIRRTAKRNLANTRRILSFMKWHGLTVYRFATHLIPLATHEATAGWEWWKDPELRPLLEEIGRVIRAEGFRVSTHPPQLCVLNAPEPSVFQWVEKYTAYHVRLFEAMGLDERAKIVLHVGRRMPEGNAAGLRRAAENVAQLPEAVRARLALENDDRTYSARETLALCQDVGVSMVFDWHHHLCRNEGERAEDLLPGVFATWRDRPPKVHLSSPRGGPTDRAHADYVDARAVRAFLLTAKALGDFDVMVEAKKKDLAALRLRAELPEVFGDPGGPSPGASDLDTEPAGRVE